MTHRMRIEFTIEPWSEDGHPPYVRAGLERAQQSGLPVEPGPFGTRVEGPADELYALVSAVIEAAMEAGAGKVSLQFSRLDDQ